MALQDVELVDPVAFHVRRREQLACPVGNDANRLPCRTFDHSIAAPSRDVEEEDLVWFVFGFGFGREPLTSGPSPAAVAS